MLQFLTCGLILWTEDCITICLWIGTGPWDSYYTGLRLRLKNQLFRSDTLHTETRFGSGQITQYGRAAPIVYGRAPELPMFLGAQ
jgi:hypothetical protein